MDNTCPQCGKSNDLQADLATDQTCSFCGAALDGSNRQLTPQTNDEAVSCDRPTSDWSGASISSVETTGNAASELAHAVPGYEIEELLGRGGMGVVYRARQLGLNRLAALKMIRDGAHAGPEELARFRTEAEAVARLQHPHIVQIYEIGEHGGLPYFSMEFVDGTTLAKKLAAAPQSPKNAAALAETLARAVQAAHQSGIIHRDLKPQNVLLTKDETPKIADFGLAKRLDDDTAQTHTGQVMGTPSYMSPEQAAGKIPDIAPATDVYALGAILYEMITGRPPFKGASVQETLEQVLQQEPVPPRQMQPKTPRDLETICLKCLQKERHSRYASAAELADDLRRFLDGEAIRARPAGAVEKTWRWIKRRPTRAALYAAIGLATVFLAGAIVAFYDSFQLERAFNAEQVARRKAEDARVAEEKQRQKTESALSDTKAAKLAEFKARQKAERARKEEEKQKRRAEGALDLAEKNLYLYRIASAQRELTANNAVRAEQILDECDPLLRRWEWSFLKRQCHQEVKTLALGSQTLLPRIFGHPLAISPDGSKLAVAHLTGTVTVYSTKTHQALAVLFGRREPIACVAFHPQKEQLASGDHRGRVILWDLQTAKPLRTFRHTQIVVDLAFHPSGKQIASFAYKAGRPFSESEFTIWDTESGKSIESKIKPAKAVHCLAYSPDGTQLATAGFGGTVQLWDIPTGKEIRSFKGLTRAANAVAFHPDGDKLAAAGFDEAILIWETETGNELRRLHGHGNAINDLVFDHDGKKLATAGDDQTVRIWDANTGKLLQTLFGHSEGVGGVAFFDKGKKLATLSHKEVVKLWDLSGGGNPKNLIKGNFIVMDARIERGQERVAMVGPDSILRNVVFKPQFKVEILAPGSRFGKAGGCARLNDAGRFLAAVDDAGNVWVWDFIVRRQRKLTRSKTADIYPPFAWHPDNKHLAVIHQDNSIGLWNIHTGKATSKLHLNKKQGTITAIGVSDSGKRLALGSYNERGGINFSGRIRTYDIATKKLVVTLPDRPGLPALVRFSPDGKLLASAHNAGKSHAIYLWDALTGKEIHVLRGHTGMVFRLAFSPNGKRLASAGADRTVKLWDLSTGNEAITLRGHSNIVNWVRFSAGGQKLASAAVQLALKIWTATPLEEPNLAQRMQLSQQTHRTALAIARLAQTGQCEDAIAQAEQLAKHEYVTPLAIYNLACAYSICSSKLINDRKVAKADREQLAKRYADEAMKLLHWSCNIGFLRLGPNQLKQIQNDPDLKSLRQRSDFQAFMRQVRDGVLPK